MRAAGRTTSAAWARWAVLGAEAAGAFAILGWWLPQRAAWINGGVLFAAYLVLAGWLWTAAGAWIRDDAASLSWPALLLGPLACGAFVLGASGADAGVVNFSAIPAFAMGALLWTALAAEARGPQGPAQPAWRRSLGLLVLGLALGALVVFLRHWAQQTLKWPEDKTSVGMVMLGRVGGGATDIGGMGFAQGGWLWVVALYAALFAGAAAIRRRLDERRQLWLLFGLALLGKLAYAGLSTQGLGIIPLKITSVNTAYFSISNVVDQEGPYKFLSTFLERQNQLGFHANTHPPLPVLLYWALRHLALGSAALTAFYVMALSALALWPIHGAVKRLAGPEAAFAAAAVFISSPLSLLLGNAGSDSMALTAVAFSAWALIEAVERDAWRTALAAGAALGVAGLLSFGSASSLVFLGSWGLLQAWRKHRGLAAFALASARTWAAFSGGLLAVNALLWAASGFHFNYLVSVHTAQYAHGLANLYRPFDLWSWANAVLYAGYAGMGLMALWFYALGRGLFLGDTRDGTLYVSAAFVLTVLLAAFGRAEVQRQFLFGALFLLLPAAQALPRDRDGRLDALGLAVIVGLNLLNAAVLQVYILDYW